MNIDNEKITLDRKEYSLVNIKSVKFNDEVQKTEDLPSKDISLIPEILDKEIVHLNIQIDTI